MHTNYTNEVLVTRSNSTLYPERADLPQRPATDLPRCELLVYDPNECLGGLPSGTNSSILTSFVDFPNRAHVAMSEFSASMLSRDPKRTAICVQGFKFGSSVKHWLFLEELLHDYFQKGFSIVAKIEHDFWEVFFESGRLRIRRSKEANAA